MEAQFNCYDRHQRTIKRHHKKYLLLLIDDCPQILVHAGICTYTGEHHWLASLLLSMWPPGSVASCGAVFPMGLILLGKLSGIAANNVIYPTFASASWQSLTDAGWHSRSPALTVGLQLHCVLVFNSHCTAVPNFDISHRKIFAKISLAVPGHSARCPPFSDTADLAVKKTLIHKTFCPLKG